MPTPPARLRLRLPILSAVVLAGALITPAVLHGTGSASVRQYGATALKPPIHGLIDRIGEPDPGTEDRKSVV